MSFLFCDVDTVLFHITIIISVVFFLSLFFFSVADGCVPVPVLLLLLLLLQQHHPIIRISFCLPFPLCVSCTIQILPCSRVVVSFLMGYLHEVVGTLGRKKFNKGRLYVANEKNFIKKNGFAFARAKLFRSRKIEAR